MPVDYHEPLDDGDIPISSHYVPDVGFIGVQGSSNINTDGSSKRSSPVNLNLKQVGDVLFALGQKIKDGSISVTLASDQGTLPTLDTNSASSNTHLGNIDTATSDLVADLDTLITNTTGIATQTTLAAAKTDLDTIVTNTNKIPASPATEGGHLATIDSVQGAAGDTNSTNTVMGRLTKIRDLLLGFVFDSTDKLRASLYVKTSVAGDTVLTLGQATKANSLSVTRASDDTALLNTGTPTETTISVGITSGTALAANANAKCRWFINISPNGIYLSFSGAAAVVGQGTYLSPNGGSIFFDRYVPTGIVKAIATAASSNLLVSEG